MLHNLISVKQASQRYGYSESHIRNLLAKGAISDEKIAVVWLVNARMIDRDHARIVHKKNKNKSC